MTAERQTLPVNKVFQEVGSTVSCVPCPQDAMPDVDMALFFQQPEQALQ